MQNKSCQENIFSGTEEFSGPVSSRNSNSSLVEYKYYGPEMEKFIEKFQEKVTGIITDDQILELCKTIWHKCKGNERDYNMAMLIIHKNNPKRTITTMDMPKKGIVSLLVSKDEEHPKLLWHRLTFEGC